ncbi:MAG: DUF2807 domain-containing protein [Bacteroidota bacterium]
MRSKNSYLTLITVLVFHSIFISCNNCTEGVGQIESRLLTLDSFSVIELSLSTDVIIRQGESQEISVRGNPNILDRLNQNVSSDGTWSVNLGNGCFTDFILEVEIIVPDINRVIVNGSGNLMLTEFSSSETLSIDIFGSGDVRMNNGFIGAGLNVNISGSGSVTATGNFNPINNLSIVISGSGRFEGFPVRTNDCDISISGSGSSEVNVVDNLNVIISGSGSVLYRVNPTITQTINGSGNLINDN